MESPRRREQPATSRVAAILGLFTWAGAPGRSKPSRRRNDGSTRHGRARVGRSHGRSRAWTKANGAGPVGTVRAHRRDGHRPAPTRRRSQNATIVDPRRPHRRRRPGRVDVQSPPACRPSTRRGTTIVPGLWDMHAHASQIDWAPVYLASGVTTIRDMGGETAFLVAIRDAIDRGRALGPRLSARRPRRRPGPARVRRGHRGHAGRRRAPSCAGTTTTAFEQIEDLLDRDAPTSCAAIIDEAHRSA